MKGRVPIFATLAVACSLLAPSTVRAQAAEPLEQEVVPVPEVKPELRREPPEQPDDDDWYGYEIIGTDALGWAAIFSGGELGEGGLVFTGSLLLLVGGPLVHMSTHHGEAGTKSFFSRLLMPLAGLAVGVLAVSVLGDGDEDSSLGPMVGGGYGALFGVAMSEILDWTVYSTPEPSGVTATEPSGSSSRPTLMLVPTGAGVGIGGTF